ncbi:SHOCT domain-containing protein [Halomicroarcula sp. S1AR25-4]|uniref:SHOCT domain-containing protein n=1 Tax=Haloarcula sp. S1AR25-4 TaxID=2950538 RepID=UPI0028748CBF|nr:SHOCT domain-containing protein [Halomicroarcula sp. S1AR25-4]MDS0278570.1 SHOCT domain-containing protein [Halomicroarcula sp. S1AR25-4]
MPPTLPKKKFAGVVAVLTFGLTALFPIAGLPKLAAATAILGFLVVLPLVGILGADFPLVESDATSQARSSEPEPTESPIERLRDRYARGEVSDEEFERRLERLLETEDLAATVVDDRAAEPELT